MQARKRESSSIDTVSGAEFYPVVRFELLPATGNQIGRRRCQGENERPGEVDTSVSDLPRKMCSRSLAKAPSPRSDVQGRDLAMVTEIVRNPCSFALFSQERCLALLERLCTCPHASSCSCLRGPFARCDLPLPCRTHPGGYPCAGQAWLGHPFVSGQFMWHATRYHESEAYVRCWPGRGLGHVVYHKPVLLSHLR